MQSMPRRCTGGSNILLTGVEGVKGGYGRTHLNPSAVAAAPPFSKGGKESAENYSMALKVPLAKGGWPAGPGGFAKAWQSLQ